jgi:hypothetical protein
MVSLPLEQRKQVSHLRHPPSYDKNLESEEYLENEDSTVETIKSEIIAMYIDKYDQAW